MRSTAVSEVYCQTGGIPGGQTDGNETKTIPDRELERVGKRRNVEDLLAVVSGLQAVGGRGSRCVLNGSQGGDSRRQISILQVKRVVAVRTAGRQAFPVTSVCHRHWSRSSSSARARIVRDL